MLHLFYDMRVVTTFFTILLVIVLLAIGTFFIGRESLLYWGVNSFRASLGNLQAQAKNGSYAARCQEEDPGFFAVQSVQTQLRFTSDTEYVIEATCDARSTKPILISKNHLPPFITKVPGGSGVIWGSARSAVELEVFGGMVSEAARVANIDVSFLEKKKIIGVEALSIVVPGKNDKELGDGPVTSCEGYGFECCKVETEIGVGESISGLNECSDSCFSSCSSRPVVLSFMTSPFYDVKTRTVTISTGGMIDFNYVADASEASTVQVTVDFGDGSPPIVTAEDTGKLTHQYKCDLPSCTYTAKIRVVDTWQVASYDATLNSITVVVTGE